MYNNPQLLKNYNKCEFKKFIKQIIFSQGYCESRDTAFTDKIHSPPAIRVIGTLRNMPEFAKLYNCKEESDMNASEKFDLWSVPSEPMEM